MIAFLLGRAFIMQDLSPFAVPYVFVLYAWRKEWVKPAAGALVLGAWTRSDEAAWMALLSILLAFAVLPLLKKVKRDIWTLIPFAVFTTIFASRAVYEYIMQGGWSLHQITMNAVEALLGTVLTFIFFQSLPLLAARKHHTPLKNEELISLVILLASVMTGTIGWVYQDLAVQNVLSRYLLLSFAFVGGGTVGASVGVVIGLILSLANVEAIYEISVLAFSGLLAGMLKEGKRLGSAFGLLVGSAILAIYAGNTSQILNSVAESLLAAVCFMLTPASALRLLSRYIPGTWEYQESQQEYLRKVRDVTVGKIRQFSDLFKQLSRSFQTFSGRLSEEADEADLFLSDVTEKTCQQCWKKEICWGKHFQDTYDALREVMQRVESRDVKIFDLPSEWRSRCIKIEQMLDVMDREYEAFRAYQQVNQQIEESRQLVTEQLSGVSKVMKDFADEIQKESQELNQQEEQILDAIEELGLSVHDVKIVSLEEGNVDIEIYQPAYHEGDECDKIIAPLLSDLLGETIVVRQKEPGVNGVTAVYLSSAKKYEVVTGVAGAAKDGKLLSGDTYKMMELGSGKLALAISDGMGNGERAHMESMSTLELLHDLLKSGMDETLAIKSINSILQLRSTDEMFATLDLALIDLHKADAQFLKIGSTPSFIKRGKQVIPIQANNLPVGILKEIDVDIVSARLKPGDLLIMVSDGIYDAPRHIENKEKWMRRLITELETEEPQEVADCLLEKVIRNHYGEIVDDMTVMVSRMDNYLPEWSTISIPGADKIQRPRTVS